LKYDEYLKYSVKERRRSLLYEISQGRLLSKKNRTKYAKCLIKKEARTLSEESGVFKTGLGDYNV